MSIKQQLEKIIDDLNFESSSPKILALKSHESPDELESIEFEEYLKVLPDGERGKVVYAYAKSGKTVGFSQHGNHFRVPRINHGSFLTGICQRYEKVVLCMSVNAYESYLNDGFEVYGAPIIVVTKSREYDGHEITTVPDLKSLRKEILAYTAIGGNVVLNGISLFEEFKDLVHEGFVLDSKGPVSFPFNSKRQTFEEFWNFKESELVKNSPIKGVSRKPVTLSFHEVIR